jgi:polyphosphate glucokinase
VGSFVVPEGRAGMSGVTNRLPGVIGVDIGGTGIKAALADLDVGSLINDRIRLETPHPATPDSVARTVNTLLGQLGGEGPIGLALPAVIRRGIVETAANIDEAWIGINASALFESMTDREVGVVNDADAAGIAEVTYGAGKGVEGVIAVITLGTGIGSAVFVDGRLVPNTELGHLQLRGRDAEDWAAASVRQHDELSWRQWGHRLQRYLEQIERVLWPNLIIVGGGVSKEFDQFRTHINLATEIVPATLHNDAGIVGAALSAPSR